MARRPRATDQAKYGIGEWYGKLYKNIGSTERAAYLNPSPIPDCPFLAAVPDLAPRGSIKCSKKGGVCSIRNFTEQEDGQLRFGPLTATCPNRFLEDRTVIKEIGSRLIRTDDPVVVKEIAFLRRVTAAPVAGDDVDLVNEAAGEQPDSEDVGKIDLVFVHPDRDPLEWCAVEMQAVYFSGGSMSRDYEVIKNYSGNGIPMPGAARRPDFRSSGPKRLMPQLQIKVPSLRRWGKKMVVIIDKPFLDAMAPMETVDHVSNCDIVWVVVNYDENVDPGKAVLVVEKVVLTTLEASVVGLTAGVPTTMPEFESRLSQKVAQQKLARQIAQTPEIPDLDL
ncbi:MULTISPECIES: NotI family restriction endonuclease [unclassified Ensifer]|uniref:NotI family restriction endonuclease n=1 Tax=unclassified Ensifer TaxID=2633371 RepID=UPI0009F71A94|nr:MULTISPECIES: NotI family restriction endonuclease [unclassified Ensifer]